MRATRTTFTLMLVFCFFVPTISSHAAMAMPAPGATPTIGPNMTLEELANESRNLERYDFPVDLGEMPSVTPQPDALPEMTKAKNSLDAAPWAVVLENACPEEDVVVEQEQFVKEVLVLAISQRLDLQEAVMALNACGIRSPQGVSWSTVEFLDLLIPDEVTNPETFARIVVENFRSKAGWPIAFEAGEHHCTVVRRSDQLGDEGYHDLTCGSLPWFHNVK